MWSSVFWHSNLWLTISMFRSLWWMRNATNMQSLYMLVILLNAAFMPLSRFSVRTSGCPLSVAVACCPTTGSSGDVGVALQNDSPWPLREASSCLKDWNYCEVGSWSEPTTTQFHLKNLQNNCSGRLMLIWPCCTTDIRGTNTDSHVNNILHTEFWLIGYLL